MRIFASSTIDRWPIFGSIIEGGFIFFCQEDPVEGLPEELWNILQWARNHHGADYVMIVAEGVVHDGLLPQFDWS